MALCSKEARVGAQLVLVLVNVFVILCGLAVITVGLWAILSEHKYYTIMNDGDTEGTRIPTSLIVAGVMVVLLAALGVLGAVLAKTYAGRLLLGMYAFVLVLLIVLQVGSGAAAIRYRSRLERSLTNSANASLKDYLNNNRTKKRWDDFQEKFHCCGSNNYSSYFNLTGKYDPYVPESCCNTALLRNSTINCSEVVANITSRYIYKRGCPDAVLERLKKDQLTIAVSSIVIGLVQMILNLSYDDYHGIYVNGNENLHLKLKE